VRRSTVNLLASRSGANIYTVIPPVSFFFTMVFLYTVAFFLGHIVVQRRFIGILGVFTTHSEQFLQWAFLQLYIGRFYYVQWAIRL
jgi:hypothetical protein